MTLESLDHRMISDAVTEAAYLLELTTLHEDRALPRHLRGQCYAAAEVAADASTGLTVAFRSNRRRRPGRR
jgi:hypothetical protein